MHFLKSFFSTFSWTFFGTLFLALFWALFLGTFSAFLYWSFLETFSGTPLGTFLWEWTFIVTILSTLKCYRTLLCTFFWASFQFFLFFFTLLFSTLLKMFRGDELFLATSNVFLKVFELSSNFFSIFFIPLFGDTF